MFAARGHDLSGRSRYCCHKWARCQIEFVRFLVAVERAPLVGLLVLTFERVTGELWIFLSKEDEGAHDE
jgi:hypothetical protein